MKTLRYLLIVVMLSVASLAFATAQSLAQQPKAEMHSTSGMVYSGSTLPSAAVQGTYVTGATVGTYSPASGQSGHIRKGTWNPGGGEEPGPDEGENSEPWQDPLGDAALPLALCALAFAIGKWLARTKPLR